MSQTSLASLDLSRNLVSKIRVGAFNGLESLVSLNMRENRIERLSSAVFTGKLIQLNTQLSTNMNEMNHKKLNFNVIFTPAHLLKIYSLF